MTTQAPSKKLLPCPFCGSTDIDRSATYMQCRGCGADGPLPSRGKRWNDRAAHEPPAECGGCAEFVRLQQELCGLLGVDEEGDSVALHDRIEKGIQAWKDEARLNAHKVITCGVIATHPDPNLSRTKAYAGKWNSKQAEDVRKLRDDRDRLLAERASQPPDSEDARDAARYRFLRQPNHAIVYARDPNAWGHNTPGHIRYNTPEQLDAAIDAACSGLTKCEGQS